MKKVNNVAVVEGELNLSMEQEHALLMCTDLSIAIAGVTGGAGTGKTLVLGKVHELLSRRGRPVALCAPTGRAAKRIEELTGIKARTVHRLLRFPMPDDTITEGMEPGEPFHNSERPLREAVVIVDESSMLSPSLFQQLIDALPRNGVIRFFGDNNQLPPVEEGRPPFINVLKDFPSVTLTYNYRSGDDIIANALRILAGRLPKRNDRFAIIYHEEPMRFAREWIPEDFAESNCQIIVPTRKGSFGTLRMNPSMQLKFNKQKFFLALDRYDEKEAKLLLKPGDKFIWVKNDYKLNMYNGEIGVVDSIDDEDGSIVLLTDGREVTVPAVVSMYHPWARAIVHYDPRKAIELGYAITTHKAQGSEFDTVVLCMARGQFHLLNRRNLYTAITRAKKNVVIITDRAAMSMALRRWQGE